ncbi:MAG: 4-hydroxy-tetrahydrodipicolinate reductase [Flavobacteriales bacterium]
MKIALIGYGKMGKEIEQIALSRGHEIVFTSNHAISTSSDQIKTADVAIEFSQPDAAANNILACFELGVPVVVGTTGWYSRLNEIKLEAEGKGGTLLYATNFSIGVNILFHINEKLASIMNDVQEYEPSIQEIHHLQKLDKPSGTAITIAEGILQNLDRKKQWTLDEPSSEDLHIDVLREPEVPGTHIIKYDSEVDFIEIKHEAKSRKGFALGAVKAAEWLQNKKGVFTMKDFLKF